MHLNFWTISDIMVEDEKNKAATSFTAAIKEIIMFGFNAFFYKNRVMIENAGAYKTNEVLLAYLEYEFPDLNELLSTCKEYERKLHYPERGDEASKFDRTIQRAFMFYDRLDTIIEALPPYDKL